MLQQFSISAINLALIASFTVPKHLFYIKEIQTTIAPNASKDEGHYTSCNPKATHVIVYNEFLKGQQFLVTNLGGNVNKPYILGVIE